jgi:SAM-dependent methyltransferase
MMLGLRQRFAYFECAGCGALQIAAVPPDLGSYYAPPYYSFTPPRPAGRFRRMLMRRLTAHTLGDRSLVGSLLSRVHPAPPVVAGAVLAGLGRDARILDVGAGAGQMLVSLHDYGFRNLLGVDAFIDGDISYDSGVRVLRRPIEEVDGRFDLIMFHHSFEHVTDPSATLAAAGTRLTDSGWILIAMPIAAASWREYGTDWVELDAPRHLHVHTQASFRILAGAAGLQVRRIVWDTTSFELWGSEQYRRNIPLSDPRSHGMGGSGEIFTDREMRNFEQRAAELNRAGQAGRGSFWLTRQAG